jgi:hypothetical protein
MARILDMRSLVSLSRPRTILTHIPWPFRIPLEYVSSASFIFSLLAFVFRFIWTAPNNLPYYLHQTSGHSLIERAVQMKALLYGCRCEYRIRYGDTLILKILDTGAAIYS